MSFPFIGAGEARYGKRATLDVVFMKAPTAAQAKRITSAMPAPLHGVVDWHGPHLDILSDAPVRSLISKHFRKAARFDAAIESWLDAAHAILPIRFAYRLPDSEAGGTQFSPRHTESLRVLPKLLPAVLALARKKAATASLGLALVDEARIAKIKSPEVRDELQALHERTKQKLRDEKAAEQKKRAATQNATKKGAAPTRDDEGATAALARAFPKAGKRLPRLKTLLRPGASAESIAEIERTLKAKLHPEHKALLRCADGGHVGKIVILGSARGGAKADAEIVTFAERFVAPSPGVAIAHTDRKFVIMRYHGGKEFLMGHIALPFSFRGFKKLDAALDAAFKAGAVLDGAN